MRSFNTRAFLVALTSALLPILISTGAVAQSSASVGEPAPDFTLTDTDGDTHALSEYRGKYVVLEWVNFRCPFVRKHYGTGNMQTLQDTYTDKGVVWLSVFSIPPSHPAYFPPEKVAAKNKEFGGQQTAILMDSTGTVGQTYGATNTPHMFVISPEGNVIYKGGIDDKPTTDEADVKTARNYVRAVLDEAMNGKKVSVQTAPPYGCKIPYADSRKATR